HGDRGDHSLGNHEGAGPEQQHQRYQPEENCPGSGNAQSPHRWLLSGSTRRAPTVAWCSAGLMARGRGADDRRPGPPAVAASLAGGGNPAIRISTDSGCELSGGPAQGAGGGPRGSRFGATLTTPPSTGDGVVCTPA